MLPFFRSNLGSSPNITPTPGGGVRFSCRVANAKSVTQSSWSPSALNDASTHFSASLSEDKRPRFRFITERF
jgi:hypothetical protein